MQEDPPASPVRQRGGREGDQEDDNNPSAQAQPALSVNGKRRDTPANSYGNVNGRAREAEEHNHRKGKEEEHLRRIDRKMEHDGVKGDVENEFAPSGPDECKLRPGESASTLSTVPSLASIAASMKNANYCSPTEVDRNPHEADMFAVDALQGDEHAHDDGHSVEDKAGPSKELTNDDGKLVLAMVGLPARGKSFIARKIKAYLTWRGLPCRVFNAGKYRRKCSDGKKIEATSRADYFDTSNKKAAKEREMFAMMAMEDMLRWFGEGGKVGIFDATNTTRSRRATIVSTCRKAKGNIGIIFVESICDEEQVIENNIRCKVKTSPDFAGMDIEEAIRDIKKRIGRYKSRYETVTEDDLSYIKLFNLQSRVFCNKIYGRIGKALLEFLMAIHIGSRRIVLVRSGEEDGRSNNQYLGNTLLDYEGPGRGSHLSNRGAKFANHLGTYMWQLHQTITKEDPRYRRRVECNSIAEEGEEDVKARMKESLLLRRRAASEETESGHFDKPRSFDGRSLKNQHFKVMTSLMPVAMETAAHIGAREEYASLMPLHRGICGRDCFAQIRDKLSQFYNQWIEDPLSTQWPGGESYDEVRTRILQCIIEIEQQPAPVVVVSHIVPLQLLLSYFLGLNVAECYRIEIPLHSAIILEPLQGGSYQKKILIFSEDGKYKEVDMKMAIFPPPESTSEDKSNLTPETPRQIWRYRNSKMLAPMLSAAKVVVPIVVLAGIGLACALYSRQNSRKREENY